MKQSDSCCFCLTAVKRPRNQSSEFLSNIRTFFDCFPFTSTALIDFDNCESLQMCGQCQSFLEEWHDVNKLISQLQDRANRAKSSLTARILEISVSDVYKLNNAHKCGKLATKINSVRRRIFKEYSCLVLLESCSTGGSRSEKYCSSLNKEELGPEWVQISTLGQAQNLSEVDLKPAIQNDVEVEHHDYELVPEVNMTDHDDGDDDGPDHDYVPPEVDEMSDSEAEDVNNSAKPGDGNNNLQTNAQVLDTVDLENSSSVNDTEVASTDDRKRIQKSRECRAKVIEDLAEFSGTSEEDSESEAETEALKIFDLKAVKVIPPGGESIYIDDFEVKVVNGKFYCCDCGAMRTLRRYALDHIRKVHGPEGDKRRKRRRCLAVIDLGAGRFQRAQVTFETLADGRYQCGACDKIKKKLSRMVAHIIMGHERVTEKPLPVARPRKNLFSATELGPNLFDYQGYKIEFNEELGKYVCSLCGSKSVRRREVQFHIRSRHINPEGYVPKNKRQCYLDRRLSQKGSFMCEECGQTLDSSRHLRVHVMSAHEGKVFTCDLCSKNFKWFASLYSHKKLYHGRRELADKTPEFVCETCGKAFLFAYDLARHRRYHAENGTECQSCGKTFCSIASLKRHKKRVHEGQSSSSRPQKRLKHSSSFQDQDESSEEPVVITEDSVNVQLEMPATRGYFWQ